MPLLKKIFLNHSNSFCNSVVSLFFFFFYLSPQNKNKKFKQTIPCRKSSLYFESLQVLELLPEKKSILNFIYSCKLLHTREVVYVHTKSNSSELHTVLLLQFFMCISLHVGDKKFMLLCRNSRKHMNGAEFHMKF